MDALPDLDHAALVVVDLQRAFCDATGSVGRQGRDIGACADAVPVCQTLVEAFRESNRPVVWTQMGYEEEYTDGGVLIHSLRPGIARTGGLLWGTDDVALMLSPLPEEYVVRKNRFSAFHNTRLDQILNAVRANTVVVVGVTTSMCVESTVRDAGQRDHDVILVTDAVADIEPDVHTASLNRMAYGFCRLGGAGDLLAALATANAPDHKRPHHVDR